MNPGDVISRYRILGRIGKGGMGVVYRAEDTRLERVVALKFLPQEGFTEHSKSRFLNEARAAAKARHPHICPIHDIEEADGELFLVMAYIEGETLRRKIAWRPLDPAQAIEFATQIASGLACAHGLGIVHRDIKSGNIMVDREGHASILDFGLALAPNALRLTDAGAAVGTPAYMSPEQIDGREVDARTDLWSLGVVMFEMLTGALPFRRDHPSAIIHAVLHDPLPELSSLRADVPPELERIVKKALAKDLARRWQSASEMLAELKRQGGSGSVSALEGPATQTIALPSTQAVRVKRGRTATIAAGLLVAAAGGLGLYYFRDLRASRGANSPAAVSVPAAPNRPATKQVAVLPFRVIGTAEVTRTVADGLVEILAAALSDFERFPGSFAAIAPSDLRSRGVTSAEEARRVYGANLALTGSAQPAGDKVEFTVSLVDAVTLRQVGARTFLYDPKNPLTSRDQAVTEVVGLMKLDVPAAARSLVTAGDTAAPNAYSAYLEGRGFLARHDLPGNVDRAIASFASAIRQDPKYALAYAGLGEGYWRKATATGEQQWAVLADQNAEQAVQLDGNLALAHSVLGTVYLDAGRQQDAIREFQHAMDLAPGNADAPRKLADVYMRLGRFEDAEALYIQSTKSRPTDWYGHLLLGIFYFEKERYTEAEAAFNQAKSLTPDNNVVRRDLGVLYRRQGRYQEAIEEFQQGLRIRSDAVTYFALGGAYYNEHRYQEAVAATEAAIDLDSGDYRSWGNLGIYCRWAPGNESKSAPALRRAIELATKLADTTKSNYEVRANLAEYKARLGDAKGAQAEIEQIPAAARGPFTTRLAIVYELTGRHNLAVDVVRSNLKSAASLSRIKDDPDLAAVWRDARPR